MDAQEQAMDSAALESMTTGDLVRHALEESRLLIKAEVLHAKQELKDEVAAAKTSGILFGIAAGLALSGLALLFVAVALAIPLAEPLAAVIVAVALLTAAGVLAMSGARKLPKAPLKFTQDRLKTDFERARGQFQ